MKKLFIYLILVSVFITASTSVRAQQDGGAYFLSNAVAGQAVIYDKNAIYDHICNHCKRDGLSNTSLWLQVQYADGATYQDGGPSKFTDKKKGLLLGWDRYFVSTDIMLGLSGNLINSKVRQDSSHGDVIAYGFGIYGGWIKPKFEVKFLAGFNWNAYELNRYETLFDKTAKSTFKGFVNTLDLELAYKLPVSKEVVFRPFTGASFSLVKTPDINEKGLETQNIFMEANTYQRSGWRFGLGFNDTDGPFLWDIFVSVEPVLGGKNLQLDGAFERGGTGSVSADGASVGSVLYQGGVSAAYSFTNSLQFYANGDYIFSSKYRNVYGNLGFRYLFCLPLEKIKRYESEKHGLQK